MLRFQALAIVLIVVAAGKNADAQQNVTGISPGEMVTVTPQETRLMRGDETLARLPRGQTFEVLRVLDGWLGARVEIDDEVKVGWVWHRHVRPSTGQPDEPEATQGAYRRYSYEPRVVEPLMGRRPASSAAGQRRPTPPEVRLRPGSRRW